MTRRVLIAGARGVIGQKLVSHLRGKPDYELRLVDLDPKGDPEIEPLNLRAYDESWARHFEGVDAVVFLAGVWAPLTRWHPSLVDNFDMTINVYNAAARHGVRRVVFASTTWTLGAYRFRRGVRSPGTPPDPGVSAYGLMKLFGERIGKSFGDARGVSTVALRIGACMPGDNVPGPHMPTGAWAQDCWVSDRDMCRGVEQAIEADAGGFVLLNLMSRNDRGRWSLDETEAAIGYRPEDSHRTRVGFLRHVQAALARCAFHIAPAVLRYIAKPHW